MRAATEQMFEFDDSYARQLPELSVAWQAAAAPDPELLVLNDALAAELGADPAALRGRAGVELLLGTGVPEGVTPTAQAYSGHQFGGFVPVLGDGRALLLGEVVDRAGVRRDVHLKGSGRTPFARGGDGRAAVGPMLREYLISEAMYALGIPTTRSLAVIGTGEQVARESMLPGAVLVRVAASHLRVGTFQFASQATDPGIVRRLADYAIARHHPAAAGAEHPYLDFYRRVIEAQAGLVARWMAVGFIHGVMNTDNTTISGETIDYGPCAFLDAYDPQTVFSSIDYAGRYAYGNQPHIAQWNLARLGEALLPLLAEDPGDAVRLATEAVNGFATGYDRHWAAAMAAKLGLRRPDAALQADLLAFARERRVDFTQLFRALSTAVRGDPAPVRELLEDPAGYDRWAPAWLALDPDPDAMDRVNPVYIPRNHLVEEALSAATAGELGPVHELLDVVARPFEQRPDLDRYARPAPPGGPAHVTYCGT